MNPEYIPDPIEQMESRIERMADQYQEGVCMSCQKKVDYELVCLGPMGDGPAICYDCLGYDPFAKLEQIRS